LRLAIHHLTRYDFDKPVAYGLQRLRLTPKSTSGQSVVDWRMQVEGAKVEAEYEDQNHNRTTLISVTPQTRELTVTCAGVVETDDNAGVIGRHAGHLPLWHFLGDTPATAPGPRMRALVAGLGSGGDILPRLHRLSAAVLGAVEYQTGHTDADTTGEVALGAARGVCQDHAQIFLGCARLLGVPARYVSGYLMMNDRVEQEAGHAGPRPMSTGSAGSGSTSRTASARIRATSGSQPGVTTARRRRSPASATAPATARSTSAWWSSSSMRAGSSKSSPSKAWGGTSSPP
jgi:transglutaminase-like putative cysteine protease